VSAQPGRGRALMLAVILSAQTVANIGPLGIPAIASLIRTDLGLTLTQAGSLLSAYYVGPILMSLPAGTLADRWGVKRMLVLGQVVIALGLVALSQSASYAALIALTALAGCGYGILNPTSTQAVIAWSPPRHRASLVGVKQVGLPFGGMLGAALLPALALPLGWRPAVVMSAVPIALGTLASFAVYHDPPVERAGTATPDAAGAFARVLAMRDVWLVALATLVFAAMQTIWMSFLVLYLESVVGLTVLAASRYLALAQLGGMAGRMAFALLSDRALAGRRRVPLVIAGSGSALCSLAIAAVGPGTAAPWLVPLAVAFGFAGIGWNGVQLTLLAELAGSRGAGTALGLGLAVASLGVTLGPPLFGALVTASGSFRGPWIGLALTMLGALTLLIPVRERGYAS
jgi:MFS transporter, ACS family, aldohexuronate transporter